MPTQLLYADLTYQIRKALFNVYNALGFGHKESVYAEAITLEFNELNILFEKEKNLNVYYEDKVVGIYRPDFIIDDKVIMEIKSLEIMPLKLEKQLVNYLKGTNYKLGLLVNLGSPRLYIKRIIWG